MKPYDLGGEHEDQPFFEHLADASGWVWTLPIPLHGDIVLVGVLRSQAIAMEEKKKMGSPSTKELYLQNLNPCPWYPETDDQSGGGVRCQIRIRLVVECFQLCQSVHPCRW